MEDLLESDQAARLFPCATPRDLNALHMVSRRAAAQISSDRPWACWITDGNSVVRAEHYNTHSRLHISPNHVLCVGLPGDGNNMPRTLVRAHMEFPR